MLTWQQMKSFPVDDNEANHIMLIVGLALNLPTALAVSIFGEWLRVRDLVQLDIAVLANPRVREKFLELLQSQYFSTEGAATNKVDELQYLAWLVARGIAPRLWTVLNPKITYFEHVHGDLFDQLKVHHIETLIVNGKDEIFSLIKRICRSSRRLGCVRFSNLSWLTYPRMRGFLKNCFTTLRELHIDTVRHLHSTHFVRLVPYLANLRELMLGRMDLNKLMLTALTTHCRQLQHVQFASCPIHNESLCEFIASFTTSAPTSARGNAVYASRSTVAATTRPAANQLRTLVLKYNTGVILSRLSACIAQHCGVLTKLSLVGDYDDVSALSSDALILASTQLPCLEYLDVSKNNFITDSAILSVTEHCPQLRVLCIHSCRRITDIAVAAIAQHCAHLEELDLSWNDNITNNALTLLAAGNASLLSSLRVLKISSCRRITSFSDLQELLNRCKRMSIQDVSLEFTKLS